MKIYILPVSGGAFVVQIAFLKVIYEATKDKNGTGIIPDLVLSSSGGNVAAYMSMIGKWNDGCLMKNIHFLNSSLFVESWTPPFFPTWIAFPLTRSVYKNGQGIKNLFHKIYTPKTIQNTEIWTGTYNSTTQKAAFFCNKSFETSRIKDKGDNSYIYDSESGIYLNGDIDNISKACYASASIPYITPGVMIKENKHIDGGVAYASPLIPLSPKVTEVLKNEKLIQLYYFSSYNMDDKFQDSLYSNSVGLLVHSSLLQDRAFALNILKQYGDVNKEPIIHVNINSSKLRSIINSLINKSFIIMFSPVVSYSVTVSNFDVDNLINIIKKVENNFTVHIWILKK